MDFRNILSLFWIHSKRWTKPINLFGNREDWFFSQICLETEISGKSRQISTEIVLMSFDKLHKGYKNLDFWNFSSLFGIHLNILTKPINHFENGEDWFFSQICLEIEISWKSRQISTETVLLSWDKLNKWYQNLYFGFVILILP